MARDLNISAKDVFKYALLPGIKPRLQSLVGQGFSSLAYMMAMIYRASNILPAGHPYLRADYFGRYGVRHVLAEAARHLKFKWAYCDQIIIFFAILAGLVILAAQFAITLVSAFAGSAYAGSGRPSGFNNFADYLVTQNPTDDIAFRFLDMTFGLPGMFGSSDFNAPYFAGFHEALHGMFLVYSIALLVIGMIISIYFIGAVLIETAQTGTPFGRRYNKAWVPIRIVVAFGLLIPIGFGLNAAQWVTLYAAKWGSGFATNGWIFFNDVTISGGGTYLGNRSDLVARPQMPEFSHLATFLTVYHACEEAYKIKHPEITIKGYVIPNDGRDGVDVDTISFLSALNLSDGQDIHIRFGERSDVHSSEKGKVKSYCGEMIFQTVGIGEQGIFTIQRAYFDIINHIFSVRLDTGSLCTGDTVSVLGFMSAYSVFFAKSYVNAFISSPGRSAVFSDPRGLQIKEDLIRELELTFSFCIEQALTELQTSTTWDIDDDGRNLGWAGAAIWYNKIAQVNGAFVAVVQNIPRPAKYPDVMEYVLKENLQQNDNVDPRRRFCPDLEQGKPIQWRNDREADIANVLCQIHEYWESDGTREDAIQTTSAKISGNAFIDAINAIMGTEGLFNMCQNANVHPIAQLASLGKSIIENSLRNFGFSVASGALGGLAHMASPHLGAAANSASGFFGTVAGMGIIIGFVLFYITPFMPFLYFFFAVGGWVKGLFEAMVGVPLWALAHLRIDGEGLTTSARAAGYGYYLILEVFLRPIMILMGLLASIAIYSAMVKVLADIFHIVASNVSGYEDTGGPCSVPGSTGMARLGDAEFFRGPVDEFFFTVIYAILVYMIGTASFKLIDAVPNYILRYMGASVKGFNDERGQPAENLQRNVVAGGGAISGKLQEGAKSAGKAGEEGIKSIASGELQSFAKRFGGGDNAPPPKDGKQGETQ